MQPRPLISKIAPLDNLHLAVQQVKEKHPLLRDRAWLQDNLADKLQHLQQELMTGVFSPNNLTYYYAFSEKKLRWAQLDCRSWVAHEAIFAPLAEHFGTMAVDNCTYQAAQTEAILSNCRQWKKRNASLLITQPLVLPRL